MKKGRVVCLILLVFFQLVVKSEQVLICLNPTTQITECTFTSLNGSYKKAGLHITQKKQVVINHSDIHLPITFKAQGEHARFKIHTSSRIRELKSSNIYSGNLIIKRVGGGLKLYNKIELDQYISGVVEAESGKDQPTNFYQVQTIISRTYALANLRKHEDQGYQLCNQVHCQVFKGVARHSNDIYKAIEQTKGLILIDTNIEVAHAAFHSNCGGFTTNAEEVWSYPKHYLEAVKDTFCHAGLQYHWQKTVDFSRWETLFKHDSIYDASIPTRDSLISREPICIDSICFSKKQARSTLHLRSTQFNYCLQEDSTSVLITGRGFGHGVGLCQEGAIEMSKQNYDYRSILKHYYKGIKIISYKDLKFFQHLE